MIPKCRAWDKFYKKMIYSPMAMTSSWVLFTAEVENESCHNAIHPIEQYAIMLSTGRNDKNGKEIYKGDIVLFGYSDGSVHEKPVEVKFGLHRVGFDSDVCAGATALGFYFSPYPCGEDDETECDEREIPMGIGEHLDWDNDNIEVIGNVWEHRHLLEAQH
jgi:uncharacterized phage protein (TIGR01671 family)